MEPDLCPPWWPAVLWWLIHHHGPGPDPGPVDVKLFASLDKVLAAVAVGALVTRLGDKSIAQQVQKLISPAASDPMPALTGLAQNIRG